MKKAGGLGADSQETGDMADDPYSCGEVIAKLVSRFIGVLHDKDYPCVNSFLSWTMVWSEHWAQDDTFPNSLKGKYVGDGRYTYEIV